MKRSVDMSTPRITMLGIVTRGAPSKRSDTTNGHFLVVKAQTRAFLGLNRTRFSLCQSETRATDVLMSDTGLHILTFLDMYASEIRLARVVIHSNGCYVQTSNILICRMDRVEDVESALSVYHVHKVQFRDEAGQPRG